MTLTRSEISGFPTSAHQSCSASKEGREIFAAVTIAMEQFRGSITYGQFYRDALSDLRELAQETSLPNWDGYDAHPISAATLSVAARFLESIPWNFPHPEICAAANGDISFEWAQSPKRIVSVGVSEDGLLHFASIFGSKRLKGSMPVTSNFDSQLYDLIVNILE